MNKHEAWEMIAPIIKQELNSLEHAEQFKLASALDSLESFLFPEELPQECINCDALLDNGLCKVCNRDEWQARHDYLNK